MHKAGDHENNISPRFSFWEKQVWKTRPSHRVCAFSHLSVPIYAKFYHRQSAFSLRNMPCMRSVHKMCNVNIQQHKQKCFELVRCQMKTRSWSCYCAHCKSLYV